MLQDKLINFLLTTPETSIIFASSGERSKEELKRLKEVACYELKGGTPIIKYVRDFCVVFGLNRDFCKGDYTERFFEKCEDLAKKLNCKTEDLVLDYFE